MRQETIRQSSGTVEPKRVERLVLDPSARVLRFGHSPVVEVPADERVAHWLRIGPYVPQRPDQSGAPLEVKAATPVRKSSLP